MKCLQHHRKSSFYDNSIRWTHTPLHIRLLNQYRRVLNDCFQQHVVNRFPAKRSQSVLVTYSRHVPSEVFIFFPVEVVAADGLRLKLDSVFSTETSVLMYDRLSRLIRRATLTLGTRFLARTIFSFNIFFNIYTSTASHSFIPTPPEAPVIPFISSLHSHFDATSWSASLNLWLDWSGNGRHATVPVSLLSPTVTLDTFFAESYGTSTLNGGTNQGIRFLTNNLPVA